MDISEEIRINMMDLNKSENRNKSSKLGEKVAVIVR